MKKCSVCGYETPVDESRFCNRCGSSELISVVPKTPKILAFVYALFYVALFNSVSGVVGFVSGIVLGLAYGEDIVITTDMGNIITLVFYAVFFIVLAVLFLYRRKNPVREVALRKFPVKVIPLAALLGYAANLVLSLTVEFIPFPEIIYEQHELAYGTLADDSGNILLTITVLALLTGIIEEIIFRALVMTRLSAAFGKAWCVIISAVVFGAAHPTVISFCYATVLGVILALIFLKYDSVLPCIIVHACFNLAACIGFPSNPLLLIGMSFICLAVTVFTLYMMFKRTDATETDSKSTAEADI